MYNFVRTASMTLNLSNLALSTVFPRLRSLDTAPKGAATTRPAPVRVEHAPLPPPRRRERKLPDPLMAPGAGLARYRRTRGELFGARGPKPDDVRQGRLGDCYFMAALASVAARAPDKLREMIRDNNNGTYDVRFYRRAGDAVEAVWLRVDADLVRKMAIDAVLDGTRRVDDAVYAATPDSDGDLKRELWVAIAEKAHACFAGRGLGFWGIDTKGGRSADSLFEITGEDYQRVPLDEMSDAELLHGLQMSPFACASGHSHAYTFMGLTEREGEVRVRLRNPWGTEPELVLSLAELRRDFSAFHLAAAARG